MFYFMFCITNMASVDLTDAVFLPSASSVMTLTINQQEQQKTSNILPELTKQQTAFLPKFGIISNFIYKFFCILPIM